MSQAGLGHQAHTVLLRCIQGQQCFPEGSGQVRGRQGPWEQDWGLHGATEASGSGQSLKALAKLSRQGHLPSQKGGSGSRVRSPGPCHSARAVPALRKLRPPGVGTGGSWWGRWGGEPGHDGTAWSSRASVGAWSRWGGKEQLMSSRRSAVRGRKPINPLLVSQEGKPGRGRLLTLDFTFLFLTCTSRTVTGILKKQDFLFQWRGLCFPQS